jgi:hypothetical protein
LSNWSWISRHGRCLPAARRELDQQALAQVARADADRLERLDHAQHALDLGTAPVACATSSSGVDS